MPPLPRDGHDPRASATGTLAYLLLGPLIWAVQLTLIYGGHTLLCVAESPPASPMALVAGTTAAAFLATAVALFFRTALARGFGIGPDAAGRGTLVALARLLDLLSLFAIAWSGSTIALLEACVAAR
jgi:hypothetical protein